jgi:hypothetical protein
MVPKRHKNLEADFSSLTGLAMPGSPSPLTATCPDDVAAKQCENPA